MHGRPVPRIVARLARRAGGRRARGFFQQIDGRIGAQHFGAGRPQSSVQVQAEGLLIERNGVFKIGHIDVDQDSHGTFRRRRAWREPDARAVTRLALKNPMPRP
ncbi:hypothetical protein D3C72_2146380 [compost metagenome]